MLNVALVTLQLYDTFVADWAIASWYSDCLHQRLCAALITHTSCVLAHAPHAYIVAARAAAVIAVAAYAEFASGCVVSAAGGLCCGKQQVRVTAKSCQSTVLVCCDMALALMLLQLTQCTVHARGV